MLNKKNKKILVKDNTSVKDKAKKKGERHDNSC